MSSELEYQNLVLEKATSEQARITNRNSYMSWGYPQLTIDEYIEHTEPTIFSQCETYKLKALITLSSGQIQEVIGYYITSLFTPAQYRHKGYATKFMKLLNHKLRFECKAKFSYLYSVVGSDFYSRLDWRIFPHKEIKFKVDNRFSTSLKHSELIVAINQSNIETIINKDCEFI
ncbi:5638_t:CDS:2 [Gigaspora rosea]|nr:5638_t:CDS:2 [Gigaspora rosea]